MEEAKLLKISTDYDGTLSMKHTRKYIKELTRRGIEVHIVTTRYEDVSSYPFGNVSHDELYQHAEQVGIKKENIHFTNFEYKHKFFLENPDFIFHIDDNPEEVALMKHSKTKTIPILIGWVPWKDECEKLLKYE